jgi:hypothetical protein
MSAPERAQVSQHRCCTRPNVVLCAAQAAAGLNAKAAAEESADLKRGLAAVLGTASAAEGTDFAEVAGAPEPPCLSHGTRIAV